MLSDGHAACKEILQLVELVQGKESRVEQEYSSHENSLLLQGGNPPIYNEKWAPKFFHHCNMYYFCASDQYVIIVSMIHKSMMHVSMMHVSMINVSMIYIVSIMQIVSMMHANTMLVSMKVIATMDACIYV